MKPAIRASLVKLYYALITTPGCESRLLRGWADMISRLLPNKTGSRPKLLPSELQLDWEPLWTIMKRQVWASASDADDSLCVFIHSSRGSICIFESGLGLMLPLFGRV